MLLIWFLKAEGINFQTDMTSTAAYSFGNNNTLILDTVNSSAGIGKNPSSGYTLDVSGTATAKSIEAEKEIQTKVSAQGGLFSLHTDANNMNWL
ncbi:hypothetical protein [Abyssogena phaseoliformis symbiont]|uniref:hypothetical protein n=1 Tax=Abyssogena phaseoliformis symbiont TaxID=596095 RepID=UPI0019150DA4|nr:hypothetical protein [Abyssogena phaseoliformis symbiont]MBW5288683.1 hypothetical protein [Candidatus Ruthia sp. Apha_13_S6]